MQAFFQNTQNNWCNQKSIFIEKYPQIKTLKLKWYDNYTQINYRKISNIRRTKCQNLNDSRFVLQLSVPNPLKPSVKSIMKM